MVKMRFAVSLPGGPYRPENLRLSSQLGCTDVIGSGPHAFHAVYGASRPVEDAEVWAFSDLIQMKQQVEDFGLRLEVFEDGPTMEKIIYNLPGREEQLEHFCQSLENLGAAGIRTIKPQHMPPEWNRIMTTSPAKPTRGGATSRAFDYDLVKDAPLTAYGRVREDQLWANLGYFLKGVLPTAEAAGVRISLHPDDPPISPLQGFDRILRSVEAFDRMLAIYPSPNIGLNFCQGCFAEMGVDVPAAIRHFGKDRKIFFAHFRSVMGSVTAPGGFQEVFHDDPAGRVDMFAAMKAYYEVGFEGPMRPDHAPAMEGDDRCGGRVDYHVLGKTLALGYMKGLAESIEKTGGAPGDRRS
jgi:mannonate dehydratase